MAATEDVDVELIAAFIDGRLAGAERDRVVKLLGESEAAFEVYVDALRARADLEGGEADLTGIAPDEADVIPIAPAARRRDRRWLVAVPAAAAAVLLVVLLPTMQGRRNGAVLAMPAQTILAPLPTGQVELASALGPGWDAATWSVTRGAGPVLVDSATYVRLGVRATDLQVALATANRALAAQMAGEIIGLLGSVNLSDAARANYADIRKQITDGDSLGQIIVNASRADTSMSSLLDSHWYGLGKWFRAGELAARAHSAPFFASSGTTSFLDSAIGRERLAADDVELLRQVEGLAEGGVTDTEFKSVQEKFAELIRRHGG